jgi:superfamily II RNA helicase
MLLKLLRVEQFRIEDMLQRSYVERSSLRLALGRKKQMDDLSSQISAFPASKCEPCHLPGTQSRASIEEFYDDLQTYFDISPTIWDNSMDILTNKQLTKGRVILINYPPLGLTGRLAVFLNVSFIHWIETCFNQLLHFGSKRTNTEFT